MVSEVVGWPTKDRRGQKVDTTSLLESLLDVLTEQRVYKLGPKVWQSFIIQASKGASQHRERWVLVRRAFEQLFSQKPSYQISPKFLKVGLNASESLREPALAADLMARVLTSRRRVELPISDIVRGLEVCVENGDLDSARMIVDKADALGDTIPNVMSHRMFSLLLKGYAAKGDSESAQALVYEMVARDLDAG